MLTFIVDNTNHVNTQSCVICFANYSNTGDHRVSSLKCGHLYGKRFVTAFLLVPCPFLFPVLLLSPFPCPNQFVINAIDTAISTVRILYS